MKGVVIQPHFMPWLGYLTIINNCDKFVFYDDVQFSLEGWYRRNRVLNSFKKEPVYINAPIKKDRKLINEIMFDRSKGLCDTINQLNASYNLNKRFDEGALFVKELVNKQDEAIKTIFDYSLSNLNHSILCSICNYLEIKTEIIISSTLNIPREDKYLRVPLICEKLGITEYFNGQASKDYMYTEKDFIEYNKRGIKYIYWSYNVLEYIHYGDREKFHPRLSSLDAILSLPKEVVIGLISPNNLELENSNNIQR